MKKMRTAQSPRFGKVFRLFLLAFIAVFLLRWAYEFFFTSRDILLPGSALNTNFRLMDEVVVTNYVSDKIVQKSAQGQSVTLDQKYAQTANMSASTSEFSRDNAALRQTIAEQEAVVQSENLSGLPGAQRLAMTIGVAPERFDALVERIRAIGTVHSFGVFKEDKTGAYRKLLAEQETLNKTRASYLAIKEMGGDIKDLLLLEEKILEVEKSLQDLGVNIDLYAEEQSFCTINFTLSETKAETISVRFLLGCAQSAFFWTLGAFALFTLMLCMAWVFAAGSQRMMELLKRGNNAEEPKHPGE